MVRTGGSTWVTVSVGVRTPPFEGSDGPPLRPIEAAPPHYGGKPGPEFPYGKQRPPITLFPNTRGGGPATILLQVLGRNNIVAASASWGMLLGEPTPHTQIGTG